MLRRYNLLVGSFRHRNIYLSVTFCTFLFGVIGLLVPDFLFSIQYVVLAVLVILVGLPHGATDFLLFRHLRGPSLSHRQVLTFFTCYLSAAFGFLLCWLLLPQVAFTLFLLISVYHFGQSNCQYLKLNQPVSFVVYLLWGAFVLGGVILWHWDESSIVILQLIGTRVLPTAQVMSLVQYGLAGSVMLMLLILYATQKIHLRELLSEIGKVLLLSFTLYNTPLLIAFTIYFALWHSVGSLLNQLDFFRQKWPSFTIVNYYRQAAPYTILSLFGLVALFWGQSFLFADASLISLFLILIACVTLPHVFLIEESYKIEV